MFAKQTEKKKEQISPKSVSDNYSKPQGFMLSKYKTEVIQ